MRITMPIPAFDRAPESSPPARQGISPRLFYSVFAGLFGANVLTAIALLMSPDIAALLSGQNDQILSAYEDRIAGLRVEVDRLHSRHYAQAGDINLQLQELAQQQEVLTEQNQYVKLLAEKAAALGIDTATLPDPISDDGDASILTGSIAPSGSPEHQIEQAGQQVRQMMSDTQLALAALSQSAASSTDEILAQLRRVNIRPKLPEGDAVGGPLLPAEDAPESIGMVDSANAVLAALTRYKAARDAVETAPVHPPTVGNLRVSSGFGNRTDPFTRGRAFHSGIDFPRPQGTTVLSAGDGVVTFVGQRSGYGNVVEVDHGGGLLTRYGHLSAFLVKEGQKVDTGTPIARVGSTGRSTGPHLHFEVRRNDVAIDPNPFLAVGRALQRLLA